MARPSFIATLGAVFCLIVIASQVAEALRFQAYSEVDFRGKVATYTKSGTSSPGFTVKSYRWGKQPFDGCCVKMCNGKKQVDYTCTAKIKARPNLGNFNRVVVGCKKSISC